MFESAQKYTIYIWRIKYYFWNYTTCIEIHDVCEIAQYVKKIKFSEINFVYSRPEKRTNISSVHWLDLALNTSWNKSIAAWCQINSALNPYLGTIGPGSSRGSNEISKRIVLQSKGKQGSLSNKDVKGSGSAPIYDNCCDELFQLHRLEIMIV